MVELVLFDMDGVIFVGRNFWLDFHRRMDTERQAWELWHGLGTSDYKKLGIRTAQIWKNQDSQHFWELIDSRPLVPGIDEVFGFLNDHKVKTAIVSTGPYQLAERAQRLFHIDEIRANKLAIGADGRFTGEVDIQVDENDKSLAAAEIMTKLGGSYDTSAMVGDGASDAAIAKLVSLPIAYDSDDETLLKACRYRINAGQIRRTIDLVRQHKH